MPDSLKGLAEMWTYIAALVAGVGGVFMGRKSADKERLSEIKGIRSDVREHHGQMDRTLKEFQIAQKERDALNERRAVETRDRNEELRREVANLCAALTTRNAHTGAQYAGARIRIEGTRAHV